MSNFQQPNRRLNPMAANFTPATRTSAKRKACSSVRAALSPHATIQESRQVAIDADQLLDTETASPNTASSFEDWSDFEEFEDELLGQGASRLHQRLTARMMAGGPRRPLQPLNRNWAPSQKPAILLISTGRSGDTSSTTPDRSAPGQPSFLSLYHNGQNSGLGSYSVLPSHANHVQQAVANPSGPPTPLHWPGNRVPVEIFELIAAHLAREDITSMRLVNKEFERKVCRSLFRTAVVPFNTELYDMIVEEKKMGGQGPCFKGKDKGKMKADDGEMDQWGWRNATNDKEGKVYQGYGLRVFQGFGPYIRRFGMSFEVVENQLARPPGKHLLDPVDSYHGTYDWPAFNYARFANLNRLEETADETSRMKSAFSNLAVVSELALSMLNGLGWLEGPDKSFRTRLLQRPDAIFGSAYASGSRTGGAKNILSCLKQSVQRGAPATRFKEIILEEQNTSTALDKIAGLQGTPFADASSWPTLDRSISASSSSSADKLRVLCANSEMSAAAKLGDVDLNPNELKKEQKEWLLETEWAQRAFLESYILAVMDNPDVFSKINTLNLATISSGLLPMIARDVFWDALPSVSSVVVHVSPDWRTVYKDEAGCAETKLQNPSVAVRTFCTLLAELSRREDITRLDLGWSDGGENAHGMYARNGNVLPAPVAPLDQTTAINPTGLLVFPHLEHLTLSNCWISPPMLDRLVRGHAGKALKKLTLDSVSLTAHPHAPVPGQQGIAAAAQALINFQGQHNPQGMQQAGPQLPGFAQQFGQQALGQHQPALAQHFNQHMQQLFQNPPPGFNPGPPNLNNIPPALPNLQLWNAHMNAGAASHQAANAGMNAPHHHLPASYWTDSHRQGSWPRLLNRISPGPIFTDYLPAPQSWEQQHPPRPETVLQTIELISCGYIHLDHHPSFDQVDLLSDVAMEGIPVRDMNAWFRARWAALKSYMLDASGDKYIGKILQHIPQREADAMRFAWGLWMGWSDCEKAEEAEFDGFRPGGTGRVSGVIEKGMPLMGQHGAGTSSVTSPAQVPGGAGTT